MNNKYLPTFRDIPNFFKFDKIISIEMLEAVGHDYLETFFRKVDHILKVGGTAVI